MGIAVPGAIAAKLLYPQRRVVAVTGDGGFMMNSQELETAVRLKLPLVILIWRDNGYGVIRWKQQVRFGRTSSVDFGNPDFVRYAEDLAQPAIRVTGPRTPSNPRAGLAAGRAGCDRLSCRRRRKSTADKAAAGIACLTMSQPEEDLLSGRELLEHLDCRSDLSGRLRRSSMTRSLPTPCQTLRFSFGSYMSTTTVPTFTFIGTSAADGLMDDP